MLEPRCFAVFLDVDLAAAAAFRACSRVTFPLFEDLAIGRRLIAYSMMGPGFVFDKITLSPAI